MGMLRHDLGFSSTEKRFPLKSTCLSIYSRVVNSQLPLIDVIRQSFPWCEAWPDALKTLFSAYAEAKRDLGGAS